MAYKVGTPPGGWVEAQAARRFRLAWLGTIIFVAVAGVVLAIAVGNHRVGIVTSTFFLVCVLVMGSCRALPRRAGALGTRREGGARCGRDE